MCKSTVDTSVLNCKCEPPAASAGSTAEIWRCGHTRKCEWKGSRDELAEERRDGLIQHVCPRCGNDEFYVDKPKQ